MRKRIKNLKSVIAIYFIQAILISGIAYSQVKEAE